jgi:hypothetical protein
VVGVDEVQRIAGVGFHHLAVGDHLGAGIGAEAAGPHDGARRQADEAVAPEALAADDGFEQEAVLAAARPAGQLEVQRQRVSRSAKASLISGMRL